MGRCGGIVAKKTLKERFDAKVKVNGESGCWIWAGSHDGANYGRIVKSGVKLDHWGGVKLDQFSM
jgi:hypothetical protein